jgi:hypothetical protein
MNEFKTLIKGEIDTNQSVNWLIIHQLAVKGATIIDVKFSFVEGKENLYEPFKTNQGHLTLEDKVAYKEFAKLVRELTNEYGDDINALANLYVLINRVSYPHGEKPLVEIFKKTISNDRTHEVYKYLVEILNDDYYKHHRLGAKETENMEAWLTLFHSAQYRHSIADPLMSVLQLVKPKGLNLPFSLIRPMNAIMRATLIGWYGYDIGIAAQEMTPIYSDQKELIFLSAYLINIHREEKKIPQWLSSDLVEIFLKREWDKIGRYFLIHNYGMNFRRQQENKVYAKMRRLASKFLERTFFSESLETADWISHLEYPGHFIAICSWLIENKKRFGKISKSNRSKMLDQFIKEMQGIAHRIPDLIAEKNGNEPFLASHLGDAKYLNTLAYLFILFLYAEEDQLRSFKNICFDFKTLFYGGYRAISIAEHFAEVIILMVLSGINITNISKESFPKLNTLLKIISETILLPFVHLIEREEDIWNPQYEFGVSYSNAGRHQINEMLLKIKQNNIFAHYEAFFEKIEQIKVAQWPYERSLTKVTAI